MSNFSRLSSGSAAFSKMLERFGVVTVMNAEVHDIDSSFKFDQNNAYQIAAHYLGNAATLRCTLDTLKIANASQEGPTKTVTGGQYSNPLIKYGKTSRLEMQDALGNAEAIEALCGGLVEYENALGGTRIALHVGSDFASTKLIIGDSFFIDQDSGQQVKVKIMFYQFLPDSIFNLTQDAEGDATVFDMNGDLLTTDIKIGNRQGVEVVHGEFYSVLDPTKISAAPLYTISGTRGTEALTITPATGYTVSVDGGKAAASGEVAVGEAARVEILDSSDEVVVDTIVQNY